ncbi:MAG: ammonium transporter [Candidatus Methylacidiphilales bacterium]
MMSKTWKKLTLALLAGAIVASISGGSPAWAQEETETVTEVAAAVVEEAAPAAEEGEEPPPYETVEAFQQAPILYPKFMVDNLWVLIAAFLVFTMHLGFATLESGLTQSKNTVNVLFKNLFVVSIGLLTYAFCGFNLMYPGDFNGWFGFGGFGIPNVIPEDPEALFGLTTPVGYELDMTVWTDFIFQAMFAATAATIVSGAVAERVKLGSFMLFATLLVAISYPITGSWKWGGGWLDQMGFYDFAGSTLVHGVGGAAALACVIILGARRGKYLSDGKVRPILGHSMPLATIGVFLLWLGWFGFNGGSVLSADPNLVSFVFVTTALAAAAGAIASIFTAWILLKKPDLSMSLNGVLAGLVGITAGADSVSVMSAVIIGMIAGILVVISILFLDKIKIDDPVGAISVHGTCGVWGTLAVGIFGMGEFSFMTQLIGTVSILLFTFIFSLVVFGLIKAIFGVRVSEEEEVEGLDIGEHGQEAYPDFQPVSRS